MQDAYKRLLKPSIETEFAAQSKERADDEAIRVFAENLRQLLLASPLGQKRVMGIDPGFRTGCKVVCLDAQGNLLHNENIYPHPPVNQSKEAFAKLQKMIEAYKIEAIAIGNGTASRETEDFLKRQTFNREVQIFIVSEQGASIYSASKIARDEFPEYDVTVRGAVSIARRLMDPLAELVKIDPKSIGVGQYQHDVDQSKLKKSLDQTVENCVNLVGVNLNTASSHSAYIHIGTRPATGAEHRELPCRERSVLFPQRVDESSAHGRQGLSNNAPVSCAYRMPRTRWTIRQCIPKVTILWSRWPRT